MVIRIFSIKRGFEIVSLQKAKSIADQLRPYGIRVYLSINFASPIKVGGLETAERFWKTDWS